MVETGGPLSPDERRRLERHYAASPFVREVCVLSTRPASGPSTVRLDNGLEEGPHATVVADLDLLRRRRIVGVSEWVRFEMETLSATLPPRDRISTCHVTLAPLPRTPDGDIDRDAVERLAASGDRGTAASPEPEDPVARLVLDFVGRASGRAVWPGAHLDLDLGLDSLARVELLLGLERALGVRLDDGLATAATTVRELTEAALAGSPAHVPADRDHWTAVLGADSPALTGAKAQPSRPLVGGLLGFLLLKAGLFAARLGLGLQVAGLEHLPRRGPYLICPNHQTLADGFLISAAVPYRTWRHLFFVGASEYYATRASAWFARAIGIVPIDADGNLAGAMRVAADGLRRGWVLMLFPEGERSIDGTLKPFRRGGAILASRLQIPIVPVAITGAFARWPRGHAFAWRTFWRRDALPVRLRFGAPMVPGEAGVPADDRELARALRDRVAMLSG
jgi:long-chain acyl-CoA synthetase